MEYIKSSINFLKSIFHDIMIIEKKKEKENEKNKEKKERKRKVKKNIKKIKKIGIVIFFYFKTIVYILIYRFIFNSFRY